MATFMLVHGGGHGGWCYQFVAKILRSHGHEVYTPTMTGVGEREHLLSPAVDMNLQITDIVKAIEFEGLRDVILVGHSYGGMIITGVADQVGDRIANLVYLDAAYPENGQSLVDHAGEIMLAARQTARIVNGIELILFPGDDPMSFFGVTEPDQIEWMKPKLTPHPWKCFDQKLVLKNEAAVRRIPQSFISCTYRMDDESRKTQKALSEGRYWEIDTGHDLMISEPQFTADALMELAGMMGLGAGTTAPVQAKASAAPAQPAASANAGPVTLEGKWALKMKGPAGPVAGTTVFETINGALLGTQSFGPGMTEPITEVKVDGDTIIWVSHIKKPMKMKLEFSGQRNGGEMSGKVKAGFVGTYSFTGRKE